MGLTRPHISNTVTHFHLFKKTYIKRGAYHGEILFFQQQQRCCAPAENPFKNCCQFQLCVLFSQAFAVAILNGHIIFS